MNPMVAALLMLANAALAFFLSWSGGKLDETFIGAVLCALTLGLLALLLAVRPRGFVIVLARGVAYAIIITVVALALFTGAAFALGASARAWREAAIGISVLAVQVFLLRAIPLSESDRPRRIVKTVFGTGFAFLLGLGIFYVSMLGANVAEFAMLAPRVKADSVMRSSIPRVQACAVAFAKDRGGYPSSLAELGPPPGGNGCLDESYASGRLGAVTLRYVPGAPDSAGVRRTFQVWSGGNIGYEKGEPWVAFGDQTGIIRRGDSAASPAEIPVIHGGMLAVRTFRACAELRRLAHLSTGYQRAWKDTYEVRETDTQDQSMKWLGCGWDNQAAHINFDPTHKMISQGTYTPIGDSTLVTDYVLEIRPRVYGVTGVRSIRTTARGPVYSTVEDRAATEQDAVVPSCEYEIGDQTCAPEAGGVPASVDVVLPDTVAHGEAFPVKITDARPAAERQRPYQYHVLCNYRKFGDPPQPPASYSFTPATQCVADSTRAEYDWVVVRVWIRDYSTTETSIYRRTRLRR